MRKIAISLATAIAVCAGAPSIASAQGVRLIASDHASIQSGNQYYVFDRNGRIVGELVADPSAGDKPNTDDTSPTPTFTENANVEETPQVWSATLGERKAESDAIASGYVPPDMVQMLLPVSSSGD